MSFTHKPGFYGQGSVEVSQGSEGEGAVRRCAISKDALTMRPAEDITTVSDLFQYAVRTHGSRKAYGWRDVIRIHEEEKEVTKNVDGREVVEKKKWKYFELSSYKFHSFLDAEKIVSEIGRGLLVLGVGVDDVFNIYSQTR